MCPGPIWMPEHQKLIVDGEGKFPGVRGFFSHLERKKYKLHVRVFLSRYRGYSVCTTCGGARLRPEAQQVKINGRNICQVCSMTVEQAADFFQSLELRPQEAAIADKLLVEIRERLALSERRRTGVPDARSAGFDALRRRSATDSAGDVAGLAAGGNALRARRALHRTAQPRHPPADQDPAQPARSGKYDSGGRA